MGRNLVINILGFLSFTIFFGFLPVFLFFTFNSPLYFALGIGYGFFFILLLFAAFQKEILKATKAIRNKTKKKIIPVVESKEKEIKPLIKPQPKKIEIPEPIGGNTTVSVKSEIIKKFGLSYKRPKKPEINRKIIPPVSQKKDQGHLPEVNYFSWRKIAELLIKKGEIEISDQWHLGRVRGADIATKIINPALKKMGIDEFQIRINDGKAKVILDERGRKKLRKNLKRGVFDTSIFLKQGVIK